MKEEIKKFKDLIRPSDLAFIAKVSDSKVSHCTQDFFEEFSLLIKQCHHIVWSIEKIQKVKIQ